ncbi:MAG: family ATPase [Ignavibacteria bacterium]|nr:family ATPase [Ignavibacteria bacterium]
MKALDLEQERTAKSLGEGHRILKGVVGSGKSLVLSCRAKYLKQLNPSWKILIVCYNISLRNYLSSLIKFSGNDASLEGISVNHFHGLVKELTGVNLSKLDDENSSDYDKRVGDILKGKIAEGVVRKGQYDAILVDEGQDFTIEWMQGLSLLLNDKSDSLLFCYDPAQNVFNKPKPIWKEAGFKVQGRRPTLLKKSYRNTVELLSIARIFNKMENVKTQEDENTIDNKLFPELATDRHGEIPQLIKSASLEDICKNIIYQIKNLKVNSNIQNMDIGILYEGALFNVSDLLKNQYNLNDFDIDFYIIKSNDRNSKLNLDISKNTIKVMPIESCKGLEFKIVFFIGIDEMPRSYRDPDSERSLAFVAMTRAQDKLYIYYQHVNEFVKDLKEAINNFSN